MEPMGPLILDGLQVEEAEHFSQFSVSRTGHGFAFTRPVMVTTRFECKVYSLDDQEGRGLLHSPPVVVSNSRDADHWRLITPPSLSPANLLVESLLLSRRLYSFSFTVTLDISDEIFELDLTHVVRFYPLHLDFRHSALSNPSRHDFTFLCRRVTVTFPWTNGIFFRGGKTFRASREILNTASPFFRHLFRSGERTTLEEDADVEVIKIVVTFLVCGDFAPPPLMTPSLAKDIIRLAERYHIFDCHGLTDAVENSCCEQFLLSSGRLEDVLMWLQMTESLFRQMERLATAVHATIVTRHWQDFAMEYGSHSSHRSPLHEMLHSRQDIEQEFFLGGTSLFEELASIRATLATPFIRLPVK